MANNQSFTLNIKALFDASDVRAKVGDIQRAFNNIKLPDNLKGNLDKSFNDLEKALNDFDSKVNKGVKTKADAKGITSSMDKVIKEFNNLSNLANKVKTELGDSVDLSKIIKLDDATVSRLKALDEEAKQLQKDLASLNASKLNQLQKALSGIKGEKSQSAIKEILDQFSKGDIEGATRALEELYQKQLKLQNSVANKSGTITNNLNILKEGSEARQVLSQAAEEAGSKMERLGQISQESAQVATKAFNDTAQGVNNASNALNGCTQKAINASDAISDAANNQARLNTELDQVKSRIQYFLGIANAIRLVRQAVRSAFNTVKDLDKAMTETAVVTEHTISDMWAKLPEYTKRANQLGVSTLDAYKSATLYYQQGLNDDQAAALSTETLKMARIAGLEAAEATDRMTNALRGFNMELNALNAQRVDDVYSQLAAHSASNVDEISTAMTKVASLAHNANMEFETTAAFLAQIIETTRESAETAGTALKTVVARFSEVKKLVDENQLKGSDEEGQVIDVNKVSAALRTAGIDLNKYFIGEVGLDDIFMELASKWDSLTAVQQRYIATQAAGSRQQSRFIALMQDYARTQELVGMAYDSTGASEKQFEKTQDSLQSKLARLKNAWNEFLMGIANSGIIKGVVDTLTLLLNVINKLTGAFGKGASGILKFAAGAAVFAGLKSLFKNGGIAEKALGSLGNTDVGRFLGLGGNTTQITSAGATFNAQVVSAGAQFAALVRGAAGAEAVTGGVGDTRVGLRLTPREAIQKFKENNLDPRQYQALSPAEKIRIASTSGIPTQRAVPKTLFGALGNKFYGTKLGTTVRKALAKLGAAGGSAVGVSGAAALAATIGTITVAAGAAALAIKKIYDLSPAGQVKIAEKYAKVMSEISDNAKKTADSYKSAQEKLKEYDDTLSEASTVSKRSDIIKERNDYIMQQMKEDSSFAKYVKSNYENGELVLTLDEESFAEATKRAAEAAEKAAVGSDFAQAALAGRQANLYQSKFDTLQGQKNLLALDGETLTAEQELLYRQYQTQMDESNRQMRQYAQKAFSQLIDSQEVGDDIANLMSEALAEGFQDEQIITGTGWLRSRAHWQNEYMKYYGQEADSSMKTADIYRAVQQAIKVEGNQGRVDELSKLLSGPGAEGIQTIVSSWLGSYDFSGVNLTLSDVNLDTLLGSDENLEPIAKALNTTVPELKKTIQNNVELEKKRQQKVNYNTAQKIASYGGTDEDIARRVADVVSLSSFEEQQAINDLLNSITNEDIATTLLDNLDNSGLREWITSLDFSNPITSLLELQKTAKNSEGVIKDLATSLQNETQFSASSLLQYFTSSSDYESLTESLGEFIDENDKLTSSKILELAEANKTLNDLLKTGQVSAAGLAAALTGIEKGTVFVGDLNDSILAALNSLDDLDGLVKRTIDDLGNFDPGYDENDVASFIKKAFDLSKENIEKGAYGNNQMRNYMEYLFGNYTGAPGDEYQDWLNNNLAKLEANADNMKAAWTEIAGSSAEAAAQYGDVSVWQENGEIVIDAAGHTTEELVSILANATGETEQWMRMMIADFKNYSDDFALTVEQADTKKAVEAWANSIKEQGYYLDKDLETLATLLGSDSDEISAILKDLWKDIPDRPKEIHWDDELSNLENVKNVLDELGKTYTSFHATGEIEDHIAIGKDFIDFDQLKQSMMDADLAGYFESTLNEMTKDTNEFYADLGRGFQEKVTIGVGQTAMVAYNQAKEKASREILTSDLASAITEALTNVNIEIETEDATTKVQTLFGLISEEKKSAAEEVSISISTETATSNVNTLATAFGNVAAQAKAAADAIGKIPGVSGTTGGSDSGGHGGLISQIPGGAKGGIVDSYGSGAFHVEPGPALTGEEGPEIVWNKEKGYAYITGQDHPQFQDLQPGDRIFNAQETRKILSMARGGSIPSNAVNSYADYHGYGDAKTGSSGGGSGSGDKKSSSEWRNELDWLYDLMEDIAEYERQQSLTQDDYDLALKDIAKTGRDLYNLTKTELENLQAQREGQAGAQAKRLQQMLELQSEVNKAGYGKYVQYNQNDKTLEIDWDAIEAITDKDTYDEVTDYLKRMETVQDQMDDAEKALKEIDKRIQELEERFLEKYLEFQNRVLDAVVKQYQDAIDNLSELNSALDDSNQSILDSIQKEIDLERQIRDNTDTESNIADMEARLAYLQRDTSGANDKEIRDLQKQLDDARESYSDTLIDQAIERLSQSNEEASEQRNKQVELMQAQLDYWKESGGLWEEVENLIATGFNSDGQLILGSELEKVLRNAENYDAMSEAQRENWANELILETNEVGAYIIKLNEGMELNAERVRALLEEISGKIGGTPEHSIAAKKDGDGGSGGGSSGGGSSDGSNKKKKETKDKDAPNDDDKDATEPASGSKNTIKTVTETVSNALIEAVKKVTTTSTNKSSGGGHSPGLGGAHRVMARFATGGLNIQAGPAWLDGTPSEPEYVLNARQTTAFLRLAEVLPAAMNGGAPTTANYGGDIYLDLNMHVDEIASDYDVDRIADRVKEIIYDASSYRNVNTLNFIR